MCPTNYHGIILNLESMKSATLSNFHAFLFDRVHGRSNCNKWTAGLGPYIEDTTLPQTQPPKPNGF